MPRLTTLTAVAAIFATPAHAEMTKVGESGFAVRHTAVVTATREQAWAMLAEPSGWWNGAHSFSGDAENLTLDPRAGGCFCEMLPTGEARVQPGSVRHMEVIFADPGSAMRLTGALGPLQSEPVEAVLTVTLKPVEGGTRILFEYVVGGTMRFAVDQIGPAVDRVIGEQLTRLADKLGAVSPAPEAVELPASSAAPTPNPLVEEPEPTVETRPAPKEFGADFLSDLDAPANETPASEDSADPRRPLSEFDTR